MQRILFLIFRVNKAEFKSVVPFSGDMMKYATKSKSVNTFFHVI